MTGRKVTVLSAARNAATATPLVEVLSEGGNVPRLCSLRDADTWRKAFSDPVTFVLVIPETEFRLSNDALLHAAAARLNETGRAYAVILVGEPLLGSGLSAAITGKPTIQVRDIFDLEDDPTGVAMVSALQETSAEMSELLLHVEQHRSSAGLTSPERRIRQWYRNEPNHKEQALAAAVALCSGTHVETILQSATEIEAAIEGSLRSMTEFEIEQTPRAAGDAALSSRLKPIGAEIVEAMNPVTRRRVTTIRFSDAGHGIAMLRHIWQEHDDVREVLILWFDRAIAAEGCSDRTKVVSAHFGMLGQEQFDGVIGRLVRPWLSETAGGHARLKAVDRMLSATLERSELARPVAELLDGLVRQGGAPRQSALALALGEVGLRRPEISSLILGRFSGVSDPEAVLASAVSASALAGQPDEPVRVHERELRVAARALHQFDREILSLPLTAPWLTLQFIGVLGHWLARLPQNREGAKQAILPSRVLELVLGGLSVAPWRVDPRLTIEKLYDIWGDVVVDGRHSVLTAVAAACGHLHPGPRDYAGHGPARRMSDVFALLARRRRRERIEAEENDAKPKPIQEDPLILILADLRRVFSNDSEVEGPTVRSPVEGAQRYLTERESAVIALLASQSDKTTEAAK